MTRLPAAPAGSANRKSVAEERGASASPTADFYQRYAPMIYRRCVAILGDSEEARDALHDVYLLLVEHLPGFNGESALPTWIYRVATNHCLNRLRSRRVAARAAFSLSECLIERREQESGQHHERIQLIKWLLDKFSKRTVRIVIHTYYDEMTQAEIAQTIGVSERSVRKALKRFREQAGAFLQAVERMGGSHD